MQCQGRTPAVIFFNYLVLVRLSTDPARFEQARDSFWWPISAKVVVLGQPNHDLIPADQGVLSAPIVRWETFAKIIISPSKPGAEFYATNLSGCKALKETQ